VKLTCPYEGCDNEITVKAVFCGRCGRKLPDRVTLAAAVEKLRIRGDHKRAAFLEYWQKERDRLGAGQV